MSIDVISIPMWTAVIISHLQDKQTHCDHIPIVYRTNRHIVITLLSSSGQTDTLWSHCSPSSGQTNTLWSHCSHLQDKQTHCDHIALIFRTNRHIVITLLSSSGQTDTLWSHCSHLQEKQTHGDHIPIVYRANIHCAQFYIVYRTDGHIEITLILCCLQNNSNRHNVITFLSSSGQTDTLWSDSHPHLP